LNPKHLIFFMGIVLLSPSLYAHSQAMLKRYYNYYTLGFEYSTSISKNKEIAFKETQQMCTDTVGSPYLDNLYKESCLYGAKDAKNRGSKMKYEIFLTDYIHKS